MEKQDAKIVGFFKATGLWDENPNKKERFVSNLCIFCLGVLGIAVVPKPACTVLVGILPVLLLVLGGYGLLDMLISSKSSEAADLKKEIEGLKKELERLRQEQTE